MKIPSLNKTEMLILTALSSKERYGLEIIDQIAEISDAKVNLSIGGLYTTLHRMEDKGLLESRWGETTAVRQDQRRKYYKASGLGLRALRETTQIFRAIANYGMNPAFEGVL
jgi:PadR family transcriptional regulator PadR